ncbi:CPBP family intramembrane metalloprotease [Flavisolibacter sp. BT320]|nr:CPBP family intramembrane metalloprotease [Flavisolibacter longurius]
MKRFLRFYALACLLSWLIWIPLFLPALGINITLQIPYNHALGGLGPLLAAFIIVFWENGRCGVKSLLKRMTRVRPLKWLALSFFSPFILLLMAGFLQALFNDRFLSVGQMFTSKEFPQFSFLLFFLYNLIFFGFGEESGWAGYGVPVLQQRFSPLSAAFIFTGFWAIWHLPLFFYRPGYSSMDVTGIIGWTLSLLTGRVLLSWFQNASHGSIFICAVFHATIDMAFTSAATTEQLSVYTGMLVTVWGITMLIPLQRKRLSKKGKPETDYAIRSPA